MSKSVTTEQLKEIVLRASDLRSDFKSEGWNADESYEYGYVAAYSELIEIRDAAINLAGVIGILNSGMGIFPYGTEQEEYDRAVDRLTEAVHGMPGTF